MTELPKLLLIDKPAGITSFGVIRKLRRILDVRKVGHAGTLDPMATGLLLIGVNEGTKELTQLIKLDKTYLATVRFGERYSTGDVTGTLLESVRVDESIAIFTHRLQAALDGLIGTHELPVSAFSAIKIAGTPLYKKAYKAAEKGEILTETPLRTMVVHAVELQGVRQQALCIEADIIFAVASGTYIRSLAEALGRVLGYPATLSALRRTHIGPYSVKDARSVESYI